MLTNKDITLYNRKYNSQTRLDEWHRTIIKGVSCYMESKTSAGEKGLQKANVLKVRIPTNVDVAKYYVDEKEFKQMSDVQGKWTLQNDDIIVVGAHSQDIEKPSDLNINYHTIFTFSDNRRGSLPHWRVGGGNGSKA